MLDHQKLILLKVKEHPDLFRKELYKTLHWIKAEELVEFRKWLFNSFGEKQLKIILEIFPMEAA